jgi:hypothetical protein
MQTTGDYETDNHTASCTHTEITAPEILNVLNIRAKTKVILAIHTVLKFCVLNWVHSM